MPLSAVEIDPTEAHRATVVWMHGLGASGHDFEPIVPYLAMPWARFVFPHAPEQPVTINGGYVMPSWYDIRRLWTPYDLQPGAPAGPPREDAAQIEASAAAIAELVDREAERVPPEHIVVAGFSQGAAMAYHVGHRYPRRLAGVMALSGYLVLPERMATDTAEANRDVPLLACHGTWDDMVPPAAGRRSFELLAHEGRDAEWREYPIGHEVSLPEMRDVGAWLRRVLSA